MKKNEKTNLAMNIDAVVKELPLQENNIEMHNNMKNTLLSHTFSQTNPTKS